MDQPTAIKGKLKAWLAYSHLTAKDLKRMQKEGNSAHIIDALTFSNADMSPNPEWLQVGFAEVTLTMLDDKHATANQLAKLQRELQNVRAANQQRENAIMDKISKLQAIDYTQEV